MSQTGSKSLLVEAGQQVEDEIKRLLMDSSLDQRLAALKDSDVLAELSPSERYAAVDIIRQRDKHGQLDSDWLAGFLKVLRVLKAEENMPETE